MGCCIKQNGMCTCPHKSKRVYRTDVCKSHCSYSPHKSYSNNGFFPTRAKELSRAKDLFSGLGAPANSQQPLTVDGHLTKENNLFIKVVEGGITKNIFVKYGFDRQRLLSTQDLNDKNEALTVETRKKIRFPRWNENRTSL